MSSLSVAPDLVSEASGKLENLCSALRSASAAAATQTTAIAAPAADQVSTAVAALLGTHGQEFQTLNAQAAAFHDEFVNRLSGGAAQYEGAELGNAQQMLANTINAPAQALAAAAANPADTLLSGFPSINENFHLGPLGISLNTTSASSGTGGLLGAVNAGVSLNTPFGSIPLLSGSGTGSISSAGQFLLSVAQTTPTGSYGASMTGSLLPAIQVTGVTFSSEGLAFSWPGTYLGGIVPNVSFS
jgi:hypothetical protein